MEPASSTPIATGDAGIALPREESARTPLLRALLELLHDLAIAALFCFFLIAFVAQAFRVQGTSMQPLLADGERIIVNKFVYRFHPIERGDVVVFWYPREPQISFIKRVVGLPGEVVELRRGALFVNGQRISEGYLASQYRDSDNYPPTEVKRGFYFVLGDHRNSSNDSRTWGEVPERYIYGKAVYRFWPFSQMGSIR
jgi:signal peptidase I